MNPASVSTAYLGYPLHITDHTVTVTTKDGRRIGHATSVKQARLMVRGYRKHNRRTGSPEAVRTGRA